MLFVFARSASPDLGALSGGGVQFGQGCPWLFMECDGSGWPQARPTPRNVNPKIDRSAKANTTTVNEKRRKMQERVLKLPTIDLGQSAPKPRRGRSL